MSISVIIDFNRCQRLFPSFSTTPAQAEGAEPFDWNQSGPCGRPFLGQLVDRDLDLLICTGFNSEHSIQILWTCFYSLFYAETIE